MVNGIAALAYLSILQYFSWQCVDDTVDTEEDIQLVSSQHKSHPYKACHDELFCYLTGLSLHG